MTKQEQIEQLRAQIAEAESKIAELSKEPTLWVPRIGHWFVASDGSLPFQDTSFGVEKCHINRAKFGHAAPDKEKAEQLRDFFAELVPKHPVPQEGQKYWVLSGGSTLYARVCVWAGDEYDRINYNAGRTWIEKPTDEEVDRKIKVLSFDSSWRWV